MKYKKKKNKILNYFTLIKYFTLTYIILYMINMINKLSINIQTVTEQVSIISVNDKQAVNQYSNSYRTS